MNASNYENRKSSRKLKSTQNLQGKHKMFEKKERKKPLKTYF